MTPSPFDAPRRRTYRIADEPIGPPVVAFVRECGCCRRNVPLTEVNAGDGLCRPCRAAADAQAERIEVLRLDRLGLKLAAAFVFGLAAIGMLALWLYR